MLVDLPPEVLQRVADELDRSKWSSDHTPKPVSALELACVHPKLLGPARRSLARHIRWPNTHAGAQAMRDFFARSPTYHGAVESIYLTSEGARPTGQELAAFLIAASGLRELRIETSGVDLVGVARTYNLLGQRLPLALLRVTCRRSEAIDPDGVAQSVLDFVLKTVRSSNTTLRTLCVTHGLDADADLAISVIPFPALPSLKTLRLDKWPATIINDVLLATAGGVSLGTSTAASELDAEARRKVVELDYSYQGYTRASTAEIGMFENVISIQRWIISGIPELRQLPRHVCSILVVFFVGLQFVDFVDDLADPEVLPHLKALEVLTQELTHGESGISGDELEATEELLRECCEERGCQYQYNGY